MFERKNDEPSEENLRRFYNEVVELLVCPIRLTIFFEPMTTNCGHAFEKGSIYLGDDCPVCRESITKIEPSSVLNKLLDSAVNCHPGFQNQRYFSIERLSYVLKQPQINFSITNELDKFCSLLRTSQFFNEVSREDYFVGITPVMLFLKHSAGIQKLERDDLLRANINAQGFNAITPYGLSALFWCVRHPRGIALLAKDNNRLCDLIDINTLMHVVTLGMYAGQSAYKNLGKSKEGKKILKNPGLQAKIDDWKRLHEKERTWLKRFRLTKTPAPSLASSSNILLAAPIVLPPQPAAPPAPSQSRLLEEQKKCALM